MTTTRPTFARALFTLLSSMRFAVSLLTVLAIASIIGTVLKQNEPPAGYIIEFGEFWARLFDVLGLTDIYHAAGFLLILLFLIISVSLCLWRHTPKILRDMQSWREQATQDSLRALPHHRELAQSCEREAVISALTEQGFKVKEKEIGADWLIVGKKGRLQKAGYLFAHAAIVVICLGGLLDGNLPLKFMELAGLRTPEVRDLPQSQVPQQSRLSSSNHAFRGNVTIPEQGIADVVFLNAGKGYYVQELPFAIQLKRFEVEHYATGQPKRFASKIELLDRQNGKVLRRAVVEVNKPLVYRGIAIYQASFGDGGSAITLRQHDLSGKSGAVTTLRARSQTSQPIALQGRNYQLEWGDFRAFNIENQTPDANASAPAGKMAAAFERARQVRAEKHTRNFGPSIQFKLRDNAGQAVEFLNYLAPLYEDDQLYQLTGSRKEPNAPFRFARIPLDNKGDTATFLRLRSTLLNPALFGEIARRTSAKAQAGGGISTAAREQFQNVVIGVLERFAAGGFPAIDRFLEEKVPEAQRQTVAQTYLKVLQGAVIDAMDVAQGIAGLPAIAVNEQQYRFLLDSLVATSGLFEYGAPVWLQLTGFEEVKASGFQLTRAPGQPIVYLGCLLLIAGVFCMFYIREVRCWVRISPQGTLFAMTANRKNDDLDREFATVLQAMTAESSHEAS